MSSANEFDLESGLAAVTNRLVNRFAGQFERSLIEAMVTRHADTFADARIVEFVPLFVERRSIESLSAESLSTQRTA